MALIINGIRVAGIGANGKDGVGVPSGGAEGQMLIKKSVTDYDAEWTDLPTIAVENGGTGATDAKTARTNLNVYSIDEVNALNVDCGTW